MYEAKVPKQCFFYIFIFFILNQQFNVAQDTSFLKNPQSQATTANCAEYQFTCKNRLKCIESIYLIDGIDDCGDDSDENYSPETKKHIQCTLPEETPDKSYGVDCRKGIPNRFLGGLQHNTTITFVCNPGYTKEGDSNIFTSHCINKNWHPPISDCKKICKRLFPSNLNLECFRDSKYIDCDGPLLSGTTVRASCKYQYVLREPVNYEEITCNENGQWSNPLPVCVLECGKLPKNENEEQMLGNPLNYNKFPWHAAIYDARNAPALVCSGTIISSHLVLTTISCVYNSITSEELKPENLQIVVSKVTPNYFIQDNEFQKSYEVSEIHNNKIVALLNLKENVVFSFAVIPACIRESIEAAFIYFYSGYLKKGKVASWGITNQTSIDENNYRVDEYERKSCSHGTNENEKFCGLSAYGSSTDNSDLGSGFIYKHADNTYYIVGVMNLKYQHNNRYVIICDNLQSNEKWINFIRYGAENDRLVQEFNSNYKTKSECEYESTFNARIQKASVCGTKHRNGIIPSCKRVCSRVQFKSHMNGSCTYNNFAVNCQDDLVEGTRLSIKCEEGYKPSNGAYHQEIVCDPNGKWSNELFPCVPSSQKQCSLPSRTKDKSYIIDCKKHSESNIDLKKALVAELTMLTFQCKPGFFRPKGNTFQVICLNGTWIPEIDDCIRFCKTFPSTNLDPQCYYQNERIECNQLLPVGTRMRPLCVQDYRKKYNANFIEELVCNDEGYWSGVPIECVPPCGSNLKSNKNFESSFLASIIDKTSKSRICTGTIITPFLVLTSARCFYDFTLKGASPHSNYEIIVGNQVLPPSSNLDSGVFNLKNHRKTYKVRNTHYTNKGRNKIIENYTEDLALIETEEKIQFNEDTIPACVNWHNSAKSDENYQNGTVAKFGKDIFINKGSYIGTEISLNAYLHSTYDTCRPYADNTQENKADLMCLQLKSKTSQQESSYLNDGDYGTGYFKVKGDKNLNHVQGVFSKKTSNPSYILMINLNHHTHWLKRINQFIEKRRILQETKKNFHLEYYSCTENTKCNIDLSHTFTYQSVFTSVCQGNVTKRQFVGGCNLPKSSEYNIQYKIWCPPNDFNSYCLSASETSPVPKYTELNYKCKPGYAIEKNEEQKTFCDTKWYPSITPCRRLCKNLRPINVILKCTNDGRTIDCNGNLVENTTVVATCLQEYEPEYNPGYSELRCLSDGEWSDVLFSCRPKCGRSAVKNITTLIRGGAEAAFGEFPWHVAIFEKTSGNTLICGGSIISPYAVVSAAHCFYDRNKQQIRPFQNYAIAVGKITYDYNKKDSEITKIYEVEKIIIENFLGIVLRYQYDISILQIKNKIEFNPQVVPICVRYSPFIIPSGEILKLCGWGYTDNDRPSVKLRVANLPYLSVSECAKKAPDDIVGYISVDKFCIANVNGTIVDKGDSGGGLALIDKSSSLHYLVGIVSYKAVDIPTVAVITDVNQYYYLNWISKHLNEIHRLKNYDVKAIN